MTDHPGYRLEENPWLDDHRVEGTPFVPLAVLAAELIHRAGPGMSLCGVSIDLPVMLRKNRPVDLEWRRNGDELALATPGGDNRITSRLVKATPFEAPSHRDLRSRSLLFVREELYPDLFFHGPAFQGDFDLETLDTGNLSARASEFQPAVTHPAWENWKPRPPAGRLDPVMLDLGIQLAALLAMHQTGRPVLPMGFDRLDAAAEALITDRLRLRVIHQPGFGYDVAAADFAGRPAYRLLGLHFQPLQRELTVNAQKELRKVREFAHWCEEARQRNCE